MAAETKISWCHRSWSPWGGCQAVSPACDHCYAETMDRRYGKGHRWGPHGVRESRAFSYYVQPHRWNEEAQRAGQTIRVFPSMCDPFDNHPSITEAMRERFWNIIADTPALTWLLLTKRPQNVAKQLPANWHIGWPHVWLGVTAENQEEADRRIPHLLRAPAAMRFLSCEPLLGPIDLVGRHETSGEGGSTCYHDYLRGEKFYPGCGSISSQMFRGEKIDWVIVGGESGAKARPMHPKWARDVRDQCVAAGVPFHLKQWGEHDAHGRRVGTKRAGAQLDGREWREFPK